MAVLNIRNLPEHVHRGLRMRAARAGRSMEAEARRILAAACAEEEATPPELDLPAWVDRLFHGRKPAGVVDELIRERRAEPE